MAFAEASEVAVRLGEQFSSEDTTRVEALLEQVALEIAGACGQDEEWADALEPVPAKLQMISIGVAARVLTRNTSVSSEVAFSDRFVEGGSLLTEQEALSARRAVFGTAVAAPRARSVLADIHPDEEIVG